MIRTVAGVVCTEKEAADHLRQKYGIRPEQGVPMIRDYPADTLAQARYSLAMLQRYFQIGAYSINEYAAINANLRRAIAKFERALNHG